LTLGTADLCGPEQEGSGSTPPLDIGRTTGRLDEAHPPSAGRRGCKPQCQCLATSSVERDHRRGGRCRRGHMDNFLSFSRVSIDLVRADLASGYHSLLAADVRLARSVAVATALSLVSPSVRVDLQRRLDDVDALLGSTSKRDRQVLECMLSHLRWLDAAERAGASPSRRASLASCPELWWPDPDLQPLAADSSGGAA
jgi:hypothetical protein